MVGSCRERDRCAGYQQCPSGSAYIFEGQGALWVQRAKLTSPSSDLNEDFGRSAALGNGFGLVGAPEWNDDTGKVYAISGAGESWSGAAIWARSTTSTASG